MDVERTYIFLYFTGISVGITKGKLQLHDSNESSGIATANGCFCHAHEIFAATIVAALSLQDSNTVLLFC